MRLAEFLVEISPGPIEEHGSAYGRIVGINFQGEKDSGAYQRGWQGLL